MLSESKVASSSVAFSASNGDSIYEGPWAIVYPNGYMFTFFRQTLTFTCRFNLYKFPFDSQRCNITFVSIDTDGKTQTVRLASRIESGG